MRLRSALALSVALASVGAASVGCPGSSTSGDHDLPLPDRVDADGAAGDATADASPEEASADSAPADASRSLRVFVSSALVNGNLGGVAEADKLCTTLAKDALLGGTYGAWLSVPGVDAIDHVTSSGPWHLVTGALVADDKAGLTTGELKHLIDVDEKGVAVLAVDDHTWTATGANGRYAGPECSLWASVAGNGAGGDSSVAGPGVWTMTSELNVCSDLNRIYCFEL